MALSPVTLTGRFAHLEPLQMHHAADLYRAAQEQGIWAYMPLNPSRSLEDMQAWIASALNDQQAGTALPFVIIDNISGKVVGSTRYLLIILKDRNLEIGSTWLAPEVQRTGINTECKYMLLRHAFETLGMIRVQLKTDSRNLQSQRAIERIGARKEGVLRKQMILHDGYIRDAVLYSIIDSEWPGVKVALEEKLKR
jgi:RimJ/RimL family protein N-acetyltransferase